MINLIKALDSAVTALRQSKPLVLCLTNFVTMDFMANSLLALGAAPLMSQAFEEIEELVTISQAVYINIGTLDAPFTQRALKAARLAKEQGKPVILDPVGAGASKLRTEAAQAFLSCATLIRGNASEILALTEKVNETKGVESVHAVSYAMEAAKQLAEHYRCTVVISGPVDFITNGQQAESVPFGSSLMPLVTGMGCTLTAIIAAFAGVLSSSYNAAYLATAYFGLCGQAAGSKVTAPGSFRQTFIDSLYAPNWGVFAEAITQALKKETLIEANDAI